MGLLGHVGPRPLHSLPDDGGCMPGFRHIEVRPVAPCLGAEVRGVDLRRRLDDATFAEVRRALLRCRVLFFHDQPIGAEQQLAFARRFGPVERHPFLPAGEVPEVIRFAKDHAVKGVENIWHSDVSWREVPSLGSVLHAIDVPQVGGDTLWADMAAAYAGLDAETRARIDGLEAVHDFTHSFGLALPPDELARRQEEFPPAVHPVVRVHPETGEKILYVNRVFTSHVVGLPRDESDALLARLFAQAEVPEYQVRFRWRRHDVALWDNRSTQHYAVSDYWPRRRVMERVTIVGDRPVGSLGSAGSAAGPRLSGRAAAG